MKRCPKGKLYVNGECVSKKVIKKRYGFLRRMQKQGRLNYEMEDELGYLEDTMDFWE